MTHTEDKLTIAPSATSIVANLNDLQAKVNALRKPHKGVILQSASEEGLRPFFGQMLMAYNKHAD